MSKSIIILGKGPSILRCNKEFVDKFDDIAICNFPVLNSFFENLIKDRNILYHFANCGTFDERYDLNVHNKLCIKNIINTNSKDNKAYANYLKNHSLIKENIKETMLEKFKSYDLDPNTGTMALQYILDTKKYNKIALVGFDNFKKGDNVYYYETKDYNKKIKYLIDSNIITKDGVYNQISGHDPLKTKKYYEDVFKKNTNIKFELITQLEFDDKYCNLTII